jgi:hypothetical protein
MASKSDAAKAKFKSDYKSGKMSVNVGEVSSAKKLITKAAVKVGLKAVEKKTASQVISHVKVKPAARTTGNPPDQGKSLERLYSSASRGGVGKGPLGKARDARVANSKKLNWEPSERQTLDAIQATTKRPTIKINSAPKPKTSPKKK